MKTFSQATRNNLVVFFIGPLFLIPAVLLMIPIVAYFDENFIYPDRIFTIAFVTAIIGLFTVAYPLTLFIGLPAIYFLRKAKKLSLLNMILAGFMGATLVTLIINPSISALLMYCYCTASVSFGCWFVIQKQKYVNAN